MAAESPGSPASKSPASSSLPGVLSLQELAEAFAHGAVAVFQVQFGLAARVSAEAKRSGPSFSGPVLVGWGELASDKGKGEVGIILPEPEFLKLMSALLGVSAEKVTPEIEDGACEILNMVFGVAKEELNRRGAGIQQVRPRLLRGLEWEGRWENSPEGLVVRIELAGVGPVALEFFIGP